VFKRDRNKKRMIHTNHPFFFMGVLQVETDCLSVIDFDAAIGGL